VIYRSDPERDKLKSQQIKILGWCKRTGRYYTWNFKGLQGENQRCIGVKKKKSFGNDLLSQGVAPQVPSALASLTAGFGMLPGVILTAQITKGHSSQNKLLRYQWIVNAHEIKVEKATSSPHHGEALDH
jgi:hypothetical protein